MVTRLQFPRGGECASVGASVGTSVGASVICSAGASVGISVLVSSPQEARSTITAAKRMIISFLIDSLFISFQRPLFSAFR